MCHHSEWTRQTYFTTCYHGEDMPSNLICSRKINQLSFQSSDREGKPLTLLSVCHLTLPPSWLFLPRLLFLTRAPISRQYLSRESWEQMMIDGALWYLGAVLKQAINPGCSRLGTAWMGWSTQLLLNHCGFLSPILCFMCLCLDVWMWLRIPYEDLMVTDATLLGYLWPDRKAFQAKTVI